MNAKMKNTRLTNERTSLRFKPSPRSPVEPGDEIPVRLEPLIGFEPGGAISRSMVSGQEPLIGIVVVVATIRRVVVSSYLRVIGVLGAVVSW